MVLLKHLFVRVKIFLHAVCSVRRVCVRVCVRMFFCQMLSSVLISGVLLVLVGAGQCPGGRCGVCREQVSAPASCCGAVVLWFHQSARPPHKDLLEELHFNTAQTFTTSHSFQIKMAKPRKWQNQKCSTRLFATSC